MWSNSPEAQKGIVSWIVFMSGLSAAVCILVTSVLVLSQVGLNIVNSLSYVVTGDRLGLQVPSYAEFTGYLFAAGSFLGLAYAFAGGSHIKVELLLGRLSDASQKLLIMWANYLAAMITIYFFWSVLGLVKESKQFGDTSVGMIPVQIWIPQFSLLVGLGLFSIAIWHSYRQILREVEKSPIVRLSIISHVAIALVLLLSVAFVDLGYIEPIKAIRSVTRDASLLVVSLCVGGGLLVALAFGIWVGFSLIISGLIGLLFFSGTHVGSNLALQSWGAINSWSLAALPLFIWMGEILFRSRLSRDMFDGLAPWLHRFPGGVVHAGILGSGIFAAVSGSSAATAATIGKVTIPRLLERGYDERLVLGVVAGSGTLGLLIPPSIILIVYGVATEQSISRLFVAGVLPGLLLVVLFMGYVMLWSTFDRLRNPAASTETTVEIPGRFLATLRLIPVVLIIGAIFTVIYAGWASPTDAAAVGVLLSLVFAVVSDTRGGALRLSTYVDGLLSAVKTSAMITFIYVGATYLTVAMGYTGIPRELATWIGSLGLTTGYLLIALTIFFMVAGCFLDGVSIVLLTTAVLLPMVEQQNINLIWFGIYLVIVVEMSQITPPVGFNLFVLQNLTGRDILFLARAAFPFFMLMILATVLIYFFPEIVLILPNSLNQ